MWRIEFTNETWKKIIVSICLTIKATILDTHTQGPRILFCLFTVRGLTFQMDVSLHKLRWANSGNVGEGEEKSLNSAEIENFCIQLYSKRSFCWDCKNVRIRFLLLFDFFSRCCYCCYNGNTPSPLSYLILTNE